MPKTTRSSRTTRTEDDLLMMEEGGSAEFGDRRRHRRHRRRHKRSLYGLFGDVKRRLRRPYMRKVVRSGRKLKNHHKIGHVGRGGRGKFRYVTRGGSVYEATVSKGHGGGRKRKAPKRHHRKGARKGRKK